MKLASDWRRALVEDVNIASRTWTLPWIACVIGWSVSATEGHWYSVFRSLIHTGYVQVKNKNKKSLGQGCRYILADVEITLGRLRHPNINVCAGGVKTFRPTFSVSSQKNANPPFIGRTSQSFYRVTVSSMEINKSKWVSALPLLILQCDLFSAADA